MLRSTRRNALRAVTAIVAAGTAFSVVATLSGPALAASGAYRFEVVQVTPAGPGKSDVTVRLVRTADGALVANADLSASAATGTLAEHPGYRRFLVDTGMAGPQTLQVLAKVPGPTRVERTFNSSVKFLETRTVRGPDKVVTGTVTFVAY